MISNSVTGIVETSTNIVATVLERVLTNFTMDTSGLEPCNHEEAETRLLLHVYRGSLQGMKKVSIVTVDTDVVIIALYHFSSLNIDELWVEFGAGQFRRFLPVHTYAIMLKEVACCGLPFWFTITGYDTVSMFGGRGKKTAWKVWCSYPEAMETLAR